MDKLKSLRNIVLKLRISGPITPKVQNEVKILLNSRYFSSPQALAVIVNSQGGSAVQSNLIRKEIQEFSSKHNIKTYTFAEDYAVSGAYLILSAGNEVYSASSSLVGCIGSSVNLFEFKELAENYGVKRRQWSTSPKDLNTMLDPLSPLTPESKAWVKSTLDFTTQQLQSLIHSSRGSKLNKEKAFTGDYFTSPEAKSLGLVDHIGTCDETLSVLFPGVRIVEARLSKWKKLFA